MKQCQKCGMPMEKPDDFCKEDESSNLCVHCCSKVQADEKEMKDPSKGNLG